MTAPVARPIERRTTVAGLAVIEHAGRDDGPRVILVHGGMDRASSFGRVARLLPDVALLRYDRRGYGRSEPGTAVDLDRHVDDLLVLLDDRPTVVFGHSLGGTIALAAAARHPIGLRAVAVFESPMPGLGPVAAERAPWWSGREPADVAETFMRTMVGDRIWDRLPPSTRQARRTEGPALVADLASVAGPEPLFDLAAIDVPVIVGCGAAGDDRHRAGAHRLAAALPGAPLVEVPGASHGVHLTHPSAVAALIGDLCAAGS